LALARPRTFTVTDDRDESQGVDIFLAVDVSPSMLARDLEPDRITALKNIATDFVKKDQEIG
jgi:Ca-activated chloride channel family protein